MSAYVGTIREDSPDDGCAGCESPTPCAQHSIIVGWKWRVLAGGRQHEGKAKTRDEAWTQADAAEKAA